MAFAQIGRDAFDGLPDHLQAPDDGVDGLFILGEGDGIQPRRELFYFLNGRENVGEVVA
jgi:hypothetical protein